MRFIVLSLKLFKGIYDILASYVLSWIIFFALLAGGFYALLSLSLSALSFESIESFWFQVDQSLPVSSLTVRLVVFVSLHLLVLWLARRRIKKVRAWLEPRINKAIKRYHAWGKNYPRGKMITGFTFSVTVTLLLIPFLLQPTLVPLNMSRQAWAHRAANLVDGTASSALVESAVGLYRKLFAEPVLAEGVSYDEFDATFKKEPFEREPNHSTKPGGSYRPAKPLPMMDRWDRMIWSIVGKNRRTFAMVKAFIYVESGGQQYAVSRTGCTGLTQFCVRTARSGGFRRIFGLGQVYPCTCHGACYVPRSIRRALESGRRDRIAQQKKRFPCDLTDARFNPRKSIEAGWLFINNLARQNGGNLYLMYIGYNSGPAVSKRLYKTLRSRKRIGLAEIGPLLPSALKPYFGRSAIPRARSLLKIHLPKLYRAYSAYSAVGPRISQKFSRHYEHEQRKTKSL